MSSHQLGSIIFSLLYCILLYFIIDAIQIIRRANKEESTGNIKKVSFINPEDDDMVPSTKFSYVILCIALPIFVVFNFALFNGFIIYVQNY